MAVRTLAAVVVGLGLLHASTSDATILTLNEDRRVASSSFASSPLGFDSDQLQEVAPDAGPFSSSLSTDAVIPDATAQSTGSQISMITGISIHGEGVATGEATAGETAIAYASAQSNIAIRFILEHPSDYTITGFLEGSQNATATLQLSRPFQTLAWYSADDELLELNHQGATLEPGTYDLNITCGATAAADAGQPAAQSAAAYDVLFLLGSATDAPGALVAAASLEAFPNPFRASTRFAVPDGVRELRVVDATGRLVRTLPAAPSTIFDGRDAAGRPLASGVYWVKAIGEAAIDPVKVVRLR